MVFGGVWRTGNRRGRRGGRRGYGRRGGGGCARNACLLESGCCIGEALDGNCLLLSVALLPQLLTTLVHGHGHSLGLRPEMPAHAGGRLLAAIGLYQQQISPHNRSKDHIPRWPAATATTGTKKFSVNNSLRANSNATKPTENAKPANMLCV